MQTGKEPPTVQSEACFWPTFTLALSSVSFTGDTSMTTASGHTTAIRAKKVIGTEQLRAAPADSLDELTKNDGRAYRDRGRSAHRDAKCAQRHTLRCRGDLGALPYRPDTLQHVKFSLARAAAMTNPRPDAELSRGPNRNHIEV